MLSCCFLDFSVGVGAFAIGLSQIYSFSQMVHVTFYMSLDVLSLLVDHGF